MRKLTNKLLSLLILMPSMAFALGLGDIRLNSALNQPLNAEIELLSVQEGEAETIVVDLASYEDFARTGIDRPAVLMFLKFKVEQRSNGDHYIHLTSREPIKEPYLDFLLDVNYRSGRLLREYTVLLDPPNMMQQAAPQVAAPMVAPTIEDTAPMAMDAPQIAPAPAPVQAAPMPRPSQRRPSAPAPRPAAQGAQAQAAPMAAPRSKTGTLGMGGGEPGGALEYGPVKKNETLWAIARRMRPDSGVSEQQMMVALLKANPEAFIDNNINLLKKGYVLRIDDPAMIRAVSKAEAVREVRRMNRAWQDYRQRVAGEAAKRSLREASAEAGRAVAAPEEARLKLVAPSDKELAKAAKPGEGTSVDAAIAQEMLEAKKRENAELQGRVQELETQLGDMQRLLELKDTDMAALQRQLRGEAPAAPAKAPAAEKPPMMAEAPQAEEAPKPAAKPKPPVAEKPAAPAKPKPAVVPPPQPAADQPILDQVMGVLDNLLTDPDPITLGGAGAGLLLLLLLSTYIRRRREGSFSESILNEGGSTSLINREPGDIAPSEESSLFSDLAISGMNSINADDSDVDPLTEADVYMAYGRHQQAEELLADAIKAHPERADIKVKMLELYYNTKNKGSFEALVTASAAALQADSALWDKVLSMGHELCPDNALFSAAPTSTDLELPAAAPEAPAGADVLDIGIDLDALTEDMESGSQGEAMDLGVELSDLGEESTDDLGMDFDLGDFGMESMGSTEESTDLGMEDLDLGADEGGMDFDLGSLDLGGSEEATAEEQAEDTGMDFDLGSLDFGTESAEETVAEEAESDDEHAMEFDISGLDFGSEESAEIEEPAIEHDEEHTLDFDLGSLGLDDEEPGEESIALAADEDTDLDFDMGGDELDDDMFGDLDEMGTKLDLAQAYIEMGDADGAKSIIDEVLADGNDEQKQQAQSLLGQLS